jgi:hypothetical protein
VDRGQPTHFFPRRNTYVFTVNVPEDFGSKELVWTLTANGRTEKAYGDLLPVQEINERIIMSGGNTVAFGDENPNKPPAIVVAPVNPASISNPVKLTATVTDDGLPKPRPPVVRPIAPSRNSAIQGQINSTTGARPRGLTVTWFQYRGPARVTFEPAGSIPVTNGSATTTARFEAPGTYTLVATANDGQFSQRTDVTVSVAAAISGQTKP